MSFFSFQNKKIFYQIKGRNEIPLVIIHGNSVSSRMHLGLMKKLAKHYMVISLDLPGHGKSERIDNWPIDFWYEQANAVAALIKHLKLGKTILLGYSGGAQIALNIALEYPEITSVVIADSFELDASVAEFAENIYEDRARDKRKLLARLYWFYMHGWDWEKIVDQDSRVIYEHHRTIGKFFHKEVEELQFPILLTGSLKDEYINEIKLLYQRFEKRLQKSKTIVYKEGKHPACLTVGKQYIVDILAFTSNPDLR